MRRLRIAHPLVLGFVLIYPHATLAQSQLFVGRWEPPHWQHSRQRLGLVFNIAEKEGALVGTVEFHDPHSNHESEMLNPRERWNILTFDVDDDYVGRPLRFSMTLRKRPHSARVQGGGGEMLLDFELVKANSASVPHNNPRLHD